MLVVGVIEDQGVTKAPHLLLLPGEPPLCTTRPPRGGIQEALGGPLGGHWGGHWGSCRGNCNWDRYKGSLLL